MTQHSGWLPRLVATDLDGTIVRTDGTISHRTRKALAAVEEAGLSLVLVTGRPPRWMAPVVEETGHRGLAICANGALVYDLHTEEVVEEHPLDPGAAAEVTSRLRRALPDITFAVERGTTFGHEPAYRPRYDLPPGVLVESVDALVSKPVTKLLARHDTLGPDALLALARKEVGGLAELTHSSNDGLLEISGSNVSKASTLARLCDRQGVSAAEVLAFGDMPNDVPMLRWAGHSVAVGNAHPEARAVVDEVTATNDDDGVALVLERYLAQLPTDGAAGSRRTKHAPPPGASA